MKPLKPKIVHATKVVIRYMGPVAGAIRGELSKPEVARALVKAVVTGAGTWGTMQVSISDPNTLTDVVVPVTAAAFTGLMDAMSRLEQGERKPDAPPCDAPPSQP